MYNNRELNRIYELNKKLLGVIRDIGLDLLHFADKYNYSIPSSLRNYFDEAEKHMLINIEMSRKISKSIELARAYMSLGYLYMQQADYEKAKSNLTEAIELLKQCHSPRDEVMCMTYIGELEYRMGEDEEAKKTLLSALSQAEQISPDSTMAGRVMRHLAEVYVRQNNFQAAQRQIAVLPWR